ncbi:hypothetical protein FO519_002729, partial [Halicephalobus sp. NKZ332]
GYDHNRFDDYNIFVFDIGGGTCDISVLKVRGGDFEIAGRAGDNQLGGRDFDNLLLNYYAKKIKAEHNFDVFDEKNLRAKIRLRELCEEAKKQLSVKDEEQIELSNVQKDIDDECVSRKLFEDEVKDLVVRSAEHVLHEKLPIGIGIGLFEDRYEIILKRNTNIPSEPVTKNFTTVFNKQDRIMFKVYEGERVIASKNTLIDSFILEVPPKPAGDISVPLTMSIDTNGILRAYAEYNGKRQELTIQPDKMVSGDNIQEMLNALETNRRTDKAEAEAKRVRTQLRGNIEFIKDACEKEKNAKTQKLMSKIKEIDQWLCSTTEPLTPEIREKFVSIEDEATKLLTKYHKTITSLKQ